MTVPNVSKTDSDITWGCYVGCFTTLYYNIVRIISFSAKTIFYVQSVNFIYPAATQADCSIRKNVYWLKDTYPPTKMGQNVPIRGNIKFETPENYPEENIQSSEQGETLKSISFTILCRHL